MMKPLPGQRASNSRPPQHSDLVPGAAGRVGGGAEEGGDRHGQGGCQDRGRGERHGGVRQGPREHWELGVDLWG